MKGLFSYLFSLAILNSCILLSSCGWKKISHMLDSPFCGTWVAVVGQEWQLERLVGRPSTVSVNIARLITSFSKHWPGPSKPGCCCVCSARGVTWKVHTKCLKCDVVICVDETCFADYHTKKLL